MPRSTSPPSRDRDRDRDRDRHHSSHHHRSKRDSERVGESSSSSSRHRDRDRDRHHHSSRSHRDDRDRDRDRKRRDDHDDRDSRREKRRHRDRETSQERQERRRRRKELDDLDPDELAAQRAAAAESLMYSTEDNPFHDSNLSTKFKWGKKEEKDKKMGLTPQEARIRDEERRRHAQEEIAKLNAARAQREAEQAIREEEEAKMARLAESAAMSEWVAKEDDFHLEQSRRRAAIRIRENRAKPIDLLAMNLRWADGDRIKNKRTDEDDDDDEAGLEIDLEEPYEIFESLSLGETEELHQDIQMYLTLDKNEQNLDFWRSMIVVCDDKLSELRTEEDLLHDSESEDRHQSRMVDPSVKAEMNKMLADKSHTQLVALQDQVRDKLTSGEPIDVEYWESLLKSIIVWRAKAKLRDLHQVVLENRLEYLRRKQRDEATRQEEELVAEIGDDDDDVQDKEEVQGDSAAVEEKEEWDADEMEPRALDERKLEYDDRRLDVHDWQSLREELVTLRRKVLGASFVPRARPINATSTGGVDASEELFAQEAAKGIDVSEERFGDEADLSQSISTTNGHYDWQDKYRPRKPRYFNRVHTGFEWNRYNQTHYDSDNPPPKIVQGYKFNIFYPDLIDKSIAPSYKIVKEPGNDETVIIQFTAGAPYEDLAFRIVNRPWQYSHKRGFRSSFERGVLQLYFNFQRNFYRK
ncbi:unnamed protein product [Sympodiomycopsis kandeliae]